MSAAALTYLSMPPLIGRRSLVITMLFIFNRSQITGNNNALDWICAQVAPCDGVDAWSTGIVIDVFPASTRYWPTFLTLTCVSTFTEESSLRGMCISRSSTRKEGRILVCVCSATFPARVLEGVTNGRLSSHGVLCYSRERVKYVCT